MSDHDEDDQLLRSAALRSGTSILRARQRAEEEMLRARGALELKTAQLDRTVAMLRATLEATTDGILVTDVEGALADFNQNFVRMWGLLPDAMAAQQQRRPFEVIRHRFADPQRFVARVDEILASVESNSSASRAFNTSTGAMSDAYGAFATSPSVGGPKRPWKTRRASWTC